MTQIVVNHLTRMRKGRICVAGLDPKSCRHLRPVTDRDRPLTRSLLTELGGAFEVGAVVDLGETTPRPNRPEVEDIQFDPAHISRLRGVSDQEYLELLESVANDSLEEAFGPDLQRQGWKYAVGKGEGECSLACVRAGRGTELEIDDRYGERLQLRFRDAQSLTFVPVNDLRFYGADHQTIRVDRVENVAERMRQGARALISFGLARAYLAPGDDAERHWLQVNGICLADVPLA